MSISMKFKNATSNLFSLISVIQSNQNILRYIKYKTEDPLDNSKEDILDDLMWSNIIPMFPDLENMPVDEEIRMYINTDGGKFYDSSDDILLEDVYRIDIFIPLTYWFTDVGELRAFNIAYEISKLVDNQHISGIGKAKIVDYDSFKIGNSHGGLTLYAQISSPKKTI